MITPEALDLPKIGDYSNPNLEVVVSGARFGFGGPYNTSKDHRRFGAVGYSHPGLRTQHHRGCL